MGRRSKLTPEVQKAFITGIQLGGTIDHSARLAGISRTTVYRWLESGRSRPGSVYRDFWDAYKKAEAKSQVNALASIQQAARAGNWQAAAWLLERRFGYTKNGAASFEYEAPEAPAAVTPLEQVQKARADAFASGSYVAGAKLVDMELKLIAAQEADSKARENAELDQMTPDELASMIRDTLASLPDELREQVLAPGGVVVPIDSARGTG